MILYRETIREVRHALRLAASLPDQPDITDVIRARRFAQWALEALDRDLTPLDVEVEPPLKEVA